MKTIKTILFFLFLFGSFSPFFAMKKKLSQNAKHKRKNRKEKSNVKKITQKECAVCHKKAQTMSSCSQCKVTTYCSVPCQTEDWTENHKYHCALIQERKQANTHLRCANTKDYIDFKLAILDNDVSSIEQLLTETDLDCNKKVSGNIPLILASEKNKPDVVEILLNNGADINAIDDEDDFSALNIAIDNNNTRVVKKLLKYHADVHYEPGDGYSALCRAIYEKFSIGIVRLLLENGADANETIDNDQQTSALQLAAENGLNDIILVLLEYGAKINYADQKGCTALHFAVEHGFVETTKILLRNGANKKMCTKSGLNPLFFAAYYDQVSVLKFFLEQQNEDINQLDDDGFSLLYIAADRGNINTARFLLLNGANVNQTCGDDKYFPLYISADSGHLDMVQLLLQRNANVNQETVNGQTALTTAWDNDHQTVIEFLQSYQPTKEKKSKEKEPKTTLTKKKLLVLQRQQAKRHAKETPSTPPTYTLTNGPVIHPQLIEAQEKKQRQKQKRKARRQKRKAHQQQNQTSPVAKVTLCHTQYDQRILRWFNQRWRKNKKRETLGYPATKYYHYLPAEVLHYLATVGEKTTYRDDDGNQLPQFEINGKIRFIDPEKNPWHPGKSCEYGIFHSTQKKENGRFFHAGFKLWQPNSEHNEKPNYIEYPNGKRAPKWPKEQKKIITRFHRKNPQQQKVIYTLYLSETDNEPHDAHTNE